MCSEYVPSIKFIIKGELLMRRIFKHKINHKSEVRDVEEIKERQRLDADFKHDRLKDSALMNYYMMGGY